MKHLSITMYTPQPGTQVRAPFGNFPEDCNVLRIEHVAADGVNRYSAAHPDAAGFELDNGQPHGSVASLTGTFKWVHAELLRMYRFGVRDVVSAFKASLDQKCEATEDIATAGVVMKLLNEAATDILASPFVGGDLALPGTPPQEDVRELVLGELGKIDTLLRDAARDKISKRDLWDAIERVSVLRGKLSEGTA